MKKIGLIGGTSPESTVLYYQHIIELSREMLDTHVYPEMVIYSVNFKEVIDLVMSGRLEDLAEIFSEIFSWMKDIGVSVGALTANTMHLVYDMLRTDIELVHIVDAVSLEAVRKGYKRLALFGTKATMESSLYPSVASRRGIEIIVPDPEDRKRINEIIFNDLVLGRISESVKKELEDMARKYLEDTDAIVLGCTELPMAFRDLSLPVIDSTAVHAREIFRRAVGV